MPFKTNLNVTPYYDDFNSANNFQQILARPGFARSVLVRLVKVTSGNLVAADPQRKAGPDTGTCAPL